MLNTYTPTDGVGVYSFFVIRFSVVLVYSVVIHRVMMYNVMVEWGYVQVYWLVGCCVDIFAQCICGIGSWF